MALSIRNPKTEAAVRALAQRTGCTLTVAIDTAVAKELKRLADQHDNLPAHMVNERRARMERAVNDFAKKIRQPKDLSTNSLYDENGLYR